MINKMIYFIKKSPFLYNLAKKFNRKLNLATAIPKINTLFTFYGYVLRDISELETIKADYENIKKYNTKLFVLIDNKDLNLCMHKLIRENPDISFSSFDYLRKYHVKLSMYRIVWINYASVQKELLDYLI